MSTWLADVCTSSKSLERRIVCAMLPVCNIKTLLDGMADVWKGSCRVPAVDVAPVLLIAEGMEPLVMPCLIGFWLCLGWYVWACV